MLSATFKYVLTGATVTFTNQLDIDSMKGHPEYELVTTDTPQTTSEVIPQVVAKKAGRPKKTENTAEAA